MQMTQPVLEYTIELMRSKMPALTLKLRNELQSGAWQSPDTLFQQNTFDDNDLATIIEAIAIDGRHHLEKLPAAPKESCIQTQAMDLWLELARKQLQQ